MDETGRKLATPRTGSQIVNRLNGQAVEYQLVLVAAWQSTEPHAPKRCVVRTDGIIRDQLDEDRSPGFPCAMLSVQYTIGGLARRVLVDAVGQSALVVWAESIEVQATWDDRRIARLAAQGVNPCREQQVAAAINSDANIGDTGSADARWLDVLNADESTDTVEWSIHEIPNGARGVRFLNALVSNANFETADHATFIAFSADTFANYPVGLVELAIDDLTDQAVVIVPAGARYMFVQYTVGTIASFDTPSWVEWIMAPNTLFGG